MLHTTQNEQTTVHCDSLLSRVGLWSVDYRGTYTATFYALVRRSFGIAVGVGPWPAIARYRFGGDCADKFYFRFILLTEIFGTDTGEISSMEMILRPGVFDCGVKILRRDVSVVVQAPEVTNSRTLPKFTSEIGFTSEVGLNTETGTAAEQTPAPSALGEAGKSTAEKRARDVAVNM